MEPDELFVGIGLVVSLFIFLWILFVRFAFKLELGWIQRWITGTDPMIQTPRPNVIDYAITGLALASIAAYVAEVRTLLSGSFIIVFGALWIWRSIRSILYFSQNRQELRRPMRVIALLSTNSYFYALVASIWYLSTYA